MTTNRVDTTLPEHSWIPFYEELAHKLVNEGWRSRQPELVHMLKEMKKDDVVPLPEVIDTLDNHIDPFSFYGTITRELTKQNTERAMISFKSKFNLKSNLPLSKPFIPYINSQKMLFFDTQSDSYKEDISALWDVFEFVVKAGTFNDGLDSEKLIGLMDAGLSVKETGISKLTAGFYWVNPHIFLHVGTINDVAKLASEEQLKANGTANDYLRCLKHTRELVQCPFPNLNIPIWVLDDHQERPKVWVARGVNGKFTSDFVSKGYVGGWDTRNGDDWSQVKTRAEIEEIYRSVYPDASNNNVAQIVPQIENFVFNMKPGDYIISPGLKKDFYYSVLGKSGVFHSEKSNRRDAHWIGGPLLKEELPSMAWSNQRTVFEVKGTSRDGTDLRNEFFKLIGRDDLVSRIGDL